MSNQLECGCHCGNLKARYQAPSPIAEWVIRECQCSFCRAHGSRTVADAAGRLELRVADEKLLSRYRWGLATADFLVCKRCGIYLAAVLDSNGRSVATLNINTVTDRALFNRPAMPGNYDAETADQRIARRLLVWTPCTTMVG